MYLEKGQVVNDDVLAFYLFHAAKNQLHYDLKKIFHLYNSCFYQTSQFNPQALLKQTRDTGIFSKKYLVIFICDIDHWILAKVRMNPNMTLLILNSLQTVYFSQCYIWKPPEGITLQKTQPSQRGPLIPLDKASNKGKDVTPLHFH